MTGLSGARILVTGASGFLGAAVVQELLSTGARVQVFLREDDDVQRLRESLGAVERQDGDLRTYSTVRRAVERANPDLVIHLAAAGVTEPFLPVQQALRHNVGGTLNLIQAVKGRAKLVLARTPGEREATNAYAASKAAAWQFARMYARAEGQAIQGVMPFQVYGPGQASGQVIPSVIHQATRGEDFPMTHGAQIRDWVHREDVARGFRLAAERGAYEGGTVELGTGVGTSLLEVVEMIYRLTRRGGKPLPGALPARPGEASTQVADAESTQGAIGWRAAVSLEEGLKRLIADD